MATTYDCSTSSGLIAGIAAAVDAVRRGQLVVMPTDTVYGVGCDAFDAEAVASLLAAKGRGRQMPPPVLVPRAATVDGLARDVPEWARELMAECWPGPLTLVLRAHSSLAWDLGDTFGTVAVRVPDHEIALGLLGQIGPMAVTSANATGQPAATTAAEAHAMLGDAVSVYLDAGELGESLASTIVDATKGDPVVLREGALDWAPWAARLAAPQMSDEAEPSDEAQGTTQAAPPEPPEPPERGTTTVE